MREQEVWCLLPLKVTSDLLWVWKQSAEISTQLSSVVVKRCSRVSLCLNHSFCHSSVTTLTNCFLFWGFDKNFLHCCILWPGWTFLYSIPVYPLLFSLSVFWSTLLYKHRRRRQYAYSLHLLAGSSPSKHLLFQQMSYGLLWAFRPWTCHQWCTLIGLGWLQPMVYLSKVPFLMYYC